jgi:glycerophosphoryl diester phosphodiesterase
MRLIAHRGFADVYPENTIAAVQKAAPRTDMIEIDVRRCNSGEIVVFHDPTLDDRTDASGRVADTTIETIEQAEVSNSGATGMMSSK